MKRLLITAVLLLTTASLFAAKPLKVNKGSLDVLRQDATATWSIDLSKATFEKSQSFEAWCEGDYQTRVQSMNDTFFESFNKYSKGLKLVNAGEAPYQLVFTVSNFERKQGPGMWGSMFVRVFGTIDIIDCASGETVCQIEVNGVKGDTDFVENDRFPKTMDWLCRDLFKMK
ncbi:MAG: hypothetical protein LIQ26_02835 [Bacteroidota bacterium]|jgi:hypothetical protein|nr:hypothetical protein [Bacteroidota bacterium]